MTLATFRAFPTPEGDIIVQPTNEEAIVLAAEIKATGGLVPVLIASAPEERPIDPDDPPLLDPDLMPRVTRALIAAFEAFFAEPRPAMAPSSDEDPDPHNIDG